MYLGQFLQKKKTNKTKAASHTCWEFIGIHIRIDRFSVDSQININVSGNEALSVHVRHSRFCIEASNKAFYIKMTSYTKDNDTWK